MSFATSLSSACYENRNSSGFVRRVRDEWVQKGADVEKAHGLTPLALAKQKGGRNPNSHALVKRLKDGAGELRPERVLKSADEYEVRFADEVL